MQQYYLEVYWVYTMGYELLRKNMEISRLVKNTVYRIYVCLIFYLLLSTASATQQKIIVCKQIYALCTSAPCIPDPRHPGYAICTCVVQQGDSAGYHTCKQRAPKQSANKTLLITSTFSFAQF